jgi:hypothetical protein
MSTRKTEEGVMVDPSSADSTRSLAGRAMSRRQALGQAGGAFAGVAALASMPKTKDHLLG